MTKSSVLRITCLFSAFGIATAMASYAQTFTKLVDFNDTDGGNPDSALILASDGNYYGTTFEGGANRAGVSGTVFQLTPSGAESVLYSFCSLPKCADGYEPSVGLVQGTDGNLYGTTYYGGAFNYGTVFKLTLGGVLTTLHSFNKTKGSSPDSTLVEAANGDFYGTTVQGGTNGYGTVYKITSAGALTVVHNFALTDGADPSGNLILLPNGNFYGTTTNGGAGTACFGSGCGTVFKMTSTGTVTTLHSFNLTDGSAPASLMKASNGFFYGVNIGGGNTETGCTLNKYCGTVFRISATGAFTTLHEFDYTDGANPSSELVQASDGNFYGTTSTGGADVYGTIYRITPTGKLTTLYAFNTAAGSSANGLVQASDGTFYGTAGGAGAYNFGTAFSFSLALAPLGK